MSDVKTTLELRLPIPHAHRCYADHFPGAPLVPGALLLKWIMTLLVSELKTAPSVARPLLADQPPRRIHYLKQVKFMAPVLPGDELRLSVTQGTTAQQLAFAAYKGDILVLKGQLECTYD